MMAIEHNKYKPVANRSVSEGESDLEQSRQADKSPNKQTKLQELKDLKNRSLGLIIYFLKNSLASELIFGVMLLFYTDVILDFQMLGNFYHHGDIKFFEINAGAIIGCLLFTFVDICRKTYSGEVANTPSWLLLLLGFALPFNMHVACLVAWSVYTDQKHEFLISAKMFESVIEATISSCVQSYALLWETSSEESENNKLKGQQLWTAYASIGMSYTSLAIAYAKFDAMETTTLGYRGQLKGWLRKYNSPGSRWHGQDVPSRLVLIAIARMCETTSRILSIAFFFFLGRDPRCWYTGLWKEPQFAFAIFTFSMNFLLVLNVQGKRGRTINALIWTIPNTICFVNPLLEKESVVSAQASHYYALRTVELVLMAAYLLGRTSHEQLWNDVCKDSSQRLFIILGVTTLMWMVLVPIIRKMRDSGMTAWFDKAPERFSQGTFTPEEEFFRDALLDSKKGLASQAKQEQFREGCFQLLDDAVKKLVSDLTPGSKLQPKPVKEEGDVEDDDDLLKDGNSPDNQPASCCNPMRYLKRWLHEQIKREQKVTKVTIETSFANLVGMSANLAPYLQHKFVDKYELGSDDAIKVSHLYIDILVLTKEALGNDEKNALNLDLQSSQYNQLLLMIPPKATQGNHLDLQMFKAKGAFVKQFIQVGFDKLAESFADKAKSVLVNFNIQLPEYMNMKPRDEVLNSEAVETQSTPLLCCMPELSIVCKHTDAPVSEQVIMEQAQVLLDIYVNVKEKCKQKLADIFNPRSEDSVDEQHLVFPWDDVENEINKVLAAYESEFGDCSRVLSGTAPTRSSVADRGSMTRPNNKEIPTAPSAVGDGHGSARDQNPNQSPNNESKAVPRALLAILAGALIHVKEQSAKCTFEIKTAQQREALLNTLVNTGMCLDTRNVCAALREIEGFPCGPMLKLETCTENFLTAFLNEEDTAEVTKALSTLQQEKQEEQIAEVVTRKQESASFVQGDAAGWWQYEVQAMMEAQASTGQSPNQAQAANQADPVSPATGSPNKRKESDNPQETFRVIYENDAYVYRKGERTAVLKKSEGSVWFEGEVIDGSTTGWNVNIYKKKEMMRISLSTDGDTGADLLQVQFKEKDKDWETTATLEILACRYHPLVEALSPGDTMVIKKPLRIPGCSESSTAGERGTILSIDERTEEVRIWFGGKGLPLTVSGKDSGDANFSKLRKVSLMKNDWARVKKSGAIGNIVATFSTGRHLVKIYPSEGGGESLRVRTESDQSSSPSYELCETSEELEAIWVVRDGLPIDEGLDCITINRYDRQAQTTSVEEIRNLCMADSNCVGFAYCPEAPKGRSGEVTAWSPKRNFTGFDPSSATYIQKHKSKNETWQWHYISHRAQEATKKIEKKKAEDAAARQKEEAEAKASQIIMEAKHAEDHPEVNLVSSAGASAVGGLNVVAKVPNGELVTVIEEQGGGDYVKVRWNKKSKEDGQGQEIEVMVKYEGWAKRSNLVARPQPSAEATPVADGNLSGFTVGEHVEKRDAGKDWTWGYVTQLKPLKVTFKDEPYVTNPTTAVQRAYCWDEVRHDQDIALRGEKELYAALETRGVSAIKKAIEKAKAAHVEDSLIKDSNRTLRRLEKAERDLGYALETRKVSEIKEAIETAKTRRVEVSVTDDCNDNLQGLEKAEKELSDALETRKVLAIHAAIKTAKKARVEDSIIENAYRRLRAEQEVEPGIDRADNVEFGSDQAEKNDEGAPVAFGTDRDCKTKYYCGRRLGTIAIPGSDGQCGPSNGPQCSSCQRFQMKKARHIKNLGGGSGNKEFLSTSSLGDNVFLSDFDGGSGRQSWFMIKGSGNWYNIEVQCGVGGNRKYLSAIDENASDMTLSHSDDASGRQRWVIAKVGDDAYTIEIVGGVWEDRKYLTCTPDGSRAFLWHSDDSDRRRWAITLAQKEECDYFLDKAPYLHVSFASEDVLSLSRHRDAVAQKDPTWKFQPLVQEAVRDGGGFAKWEKLLEDSQGILVITSKSYQSKLRDDGPLKKEALAIMRKKEADSTFRVFCIDLNSISERGSRDLASFLNAGENDEIQQNFDTWKETVQAKDASKERPATEGAGDTQAEEATEDKGAEADEEDWGTPRSEWIAEDEEAEGPETAGKAHVEGPEEVQAQTDQQTEEATLAGKIVKFRRAAELCSVQFSSKGEQSYGVVDFVRLKCIDRKASPIEYFLNEGRNTSGLQKGNIWRVIDTELFKMCDAMRSAEASPKFYALLDKLRKHISKDCILELSHIADDLKQWIDSAVGTESKAFSTKIKRLEDRKGEIEEMEKEVASTEEKLNNHKAQQAQEKSKPNQRNQIFNLGSVSEDKSPAVIEDELKEKLAAMKDAINHLRTTFDSELDDVEEEHKAQLRKAEDAVEREFNAFVQDELKKKFPEMPEVETAADKHISELSKKTKEMAEQIEKTFNNVDKDYKKRRDEQQKQVENQKQRQLDERERKIANLQRQLDEATQREQERNNTKKRCFPRFGGEKRR